MFEYISEFDLRREIRAGADYENWEPWRADVVGTTWYRRKIRGIAPEPELMGDDDVMDLGDDDFDSECDE